MSELIYWLSVLVIALGIWAIPMLLIYNLSLKNILFTQVPQGEIVAVMIGEKVHRFLANIDGHWIDKNTGEIWRHRRFDDGFDDIGPNGEKLQSDGQPFSRVKAAAPEDLPSSFLGIHWMGVWPFTKVYTYRFRWNKWEKPEGSGKDGKKVEFDIIPNDKWVTSLFFKSGYAFKVHGAETKDKAPVDAILVLVVRITNAMTALFGVKNGWYATLDGKVLGSGRDFIGLTTIDDLTILQHEEGDLPAITDKERHLTRKSFIQKMMFLNEDPPQPKESKPAEGVQAPLKGNEGIRKTLGVEIVSASFMRYDITDPEVREKTKEAMLLSYMATERAKAENKNTEWQAKRQRDVGLARAEAAGKLAAAIGTNEYAGRIAVAEIQKEAALAFADAIKEQKGAKTLIMGSSVIPAVDTGSEKEK